MSIVMNSASGVEMTLFNRILTSSMSAVGVPTSPFQLILFPQRHSCHVHLCLLGAKIAHELRVGAVQESVPWNLKLVDEEYHVGAFDASPNSLRETAVFIGSTPSPDTPVLGMVEQLPVL